APICTRCGIKFNFTTRRHHCRRCGQIYCSTCCDHKLELPRMCFIDPVRICQNCTPATLEENKFFDQQIKTLTNGATFMLENNQMILSTTDLLQCKLSPDHRHLMFDGVKLAPLDINTITALRVDKDPINGVKSVEIEYSVANSVEKNCVRLATTPELEHRKTGASWIAAMQQVRCQYEYQHKVCGTAAYKVLIHN
ncbi:zinc finger FYVE domain-containing protein 21-like, partial [Homalodisca vitripennis]|uniref:zinc finger FYVE domain-containing protein 21-like n=1 Tax=Homalodisca vitripennis TaxID=197043 RepID=UPI001EEA4C46